MVRDYREGQPLLMPAVEHCSAIPGHCGWQRDHRATFPIEVKLIGPPLHHSHTLIPVRAAVVGRAHPVAIFVSERTLNGVGMSKA